MAWPLISTGVLLELMKERTYPFTCALPYKESSYHRKHRRFRNSPKLSLYFAIETLAIFIYSPSIIYLNSFNNISISDIVSETCRCKCAFFSFFFVVKIIIYIHLSVSVIIRKFLTSDERYCLFIFWSRIVIFFYSFLFLIIIWPSGWYWSIIF